VIKEVLAMRRLLFLLPFVLAACDGDGDGFIPTAESLQHAPEISNLNLSPDTAMYMEGEGSVRVTAEFGFTDVAQDIQTSHVEISDGTSLTNDLSEPINTVSGTLIEEFDVSTASVGTFTVEIWLVDAAGNASNRLSAGIRVENPVPEIAILDPAEVRTGSVGFNLSVTGTGFLMGATVTWDGGDRTTEYVSGTQVIASIPATDLVTAGTVSVRVRNPDPTAGASNSLSFVVADMPSPEPTGFPIHITEATDDAPPNGPSVNGGLDWSGNHVFFASKASNLIASDTNDAYDLFVRKTCVLAGDDCTPSTIRAVMGVGGAEPNGDIGWTATSPNNSLGVNFNARFVAFVSSASNLVPDDTNGVDDVFLVDTCIERVGYGPDREPCTPGVIRVSLGNDGSQSTAPASYPAVADGGRYVVFVSADPNLVSGDTNGVADVFLRDTCRGAAQGCTPGTTRVSVANGGAEANAASSEPAFTGRYVAFSSLASNLVAGDSNGLRDVFLRDTCLGASGCVPSTRLVSAGHLGNPADGASSDPQVSWALSYWHGRFVVFASSATNLVPDDTNGASDVFERDLCGAEPGCTPSTARISVSSTGGQIWGDSWSPDFLRWDGETIAFVTAADLVVPGDVNGIADVYVRHHCPFSAPSYCEASTRRVSIGTNGAQTDGDSYAPRMSHDPFGAWAVTFISEASNILPDGVPIPNDGSIYMDLAY
jgi:hypothetical protein